MIRMNRQEDDYRPAPRFLKCSERFDAIKNRHRNVSDDDIRIQLLDGFQQRFAVSYPAYNLKLRFYNKMLRTISSMFGWSSARSTRCLLIGQFCSMWDATPNTVVHPVVHRARRSGTSAMLAWSADCTKSAPHLYRGTVAKLTGCEDQRGLVCRAMNTRYLFRRE
jgi:hypothetical protein